MVKRYGELFDLALYKSIYYYYYYYYYYINQFIIYYYLLFRQRSDRLRLGSVRQRVKVESVIGKKESTLVSYSFELFCNE